MQVRLARDALIKQGRHPSVDAVRAFLGNTGSNSTISRYLKELTEPSSSTSTLLGRELNSLMGDIAQRLLQDAESRFEKERSTLITQQHMHNIERTQHQEQLRHLKESVGLLTTQLKEALERGQAHLLDTRSEQIHDLNRGLERLHITLSHVQKSQGDEYSESRLDHDRKVRELEQIIADLQGQLRIQHETLGDSQAQIRLLLVERTTLRVRLRQQLLLARQLRQDLEQRGTQVSQLLQMLERVMSVPIG
ncbi:DNA-binding protein [Pseudomonas asiatica]|uniref:DNA-binding protein n=1 Tax=Pseudomonas asiatica TaxID=2219225 RepID=UPI003BA1A24A|nr:DNA-binding protein [Pseudomonas shirazica]